MNKMLVFILSVFISVVGFTQTNTISGRANAYVGQEVKVYFYKDYLSLLKTEVARTEVKTDSTFQLNFSNYKTQKIYVEIGPNFFSMYVQPEGQYNLFVTPGTPYEGQGTTGVDAEFYFLELSPDDINYKILVFEDEQLAFLENFYGQKSVNPTSFVVQLEKFKEDISTKYKSDTSLFLKTYIRFSIADLDNLAYLGERNEYEKYDFYLKKYPVSYDNDRYMNYFTHYYQKYEAQLSNEAHEGLEKGIHAGSPSVVMNALGKDYTLQNVRIRELVMIDILSDIYHTNLFDKEGIIHILDSLSVKSLFPEHMEIASNIKFRLLDLVPGSSMPKIQFSVNGKVKTLEDYKGKHLYIQFLSKEMKASLDDIKLLAQIQQRFGQYIQYVTVLVVDKNDPLLKNATSFIKEYKISWDLAVVDKDDELLSKISVVKYPYYILIDAASYIVAAPALSPRPDSNYNTIDNLLINITRYYKNMEK
ncbi:MAG: hypothetical protein H3C31_03390 [Brumimicrobium sp.]|nr:hypothetical protein [Brumimicrobium sp.]